MLTLANLKKKTELFLYCKGFTDSLLRNIMLAQFGLNLISLAAAIIFLYWTNWPFSLFVGVTVITCNFWSLSRFVFKRLPSGYSRQLMLGQIFGFTGRFLLTAVAIAVAFYLGARLSALLLGLGSCVVVITFMVMTYFFRRKV